MTMHIGCCRAYQSSFSLLESHGSMSRGEMLEGVGARVPAVSLLRGGHGEGDALRQRLLPLLRDRLDLGEELHAGLAVEIQISCEGSLAACEGEEWQRYWNWDIDSHLN
jgi:hypothetical protein